MNMFKVNDLIDQYERGASLRGIAPTQMMALRPVRAGLGHVTPEVLHPVTIGSYVSERRIGLWTRAHARKPAADGTIRRELGALSAVLNWSAAKRLIKRDDVPTIDLPPPSPERDVFLTAPEADDLWARASSWTVDRTGLFTMLALDTWARSNAIETLPWGRVDLARGQIDYRDPALRATSKRRVPVPVSKRLKDALSFEWGRVPEDHALVCGEVTQYAWGKFIETTPYAARGLTRHDLRRTGISIAMARGVDPMMVAQMAGDRFETIMKHYARFAPDYLAAVHAPS